MRRLPLLLSIAALALSLFLFYRLTVLEGRASAPKEGPQAPVVDDEEEDDEIELAVTMGRIQRFHQKWWLAGKSGNSELSKFYLHELEEAMEEVADAHVVDEGKDISAAMETYGLPEIARLEHLLEKEGVAAMHGQADMLAKTCTSCHAVTGHSYIRIVAPTDVSFPDQDFSPELHTTVLDH